MAIRLGKQDSSRSRSSSRSRTPWWAVWSKRLAKVALIGLVIGGLLLTLFLRPFYKKAHEFDLSEVGQLEAASILYDRHDKEMGRDFRVQNRLPVKIEQVPKELIRALIAVEDSRFFEHNGVDWMGIVRAALLNFKARRRTQGASTITQQLGRQTFELLDKSYGRKLTEAFLARRIEKEFSKEEILEHYLNRIFFGHGFHGVNAASYGYFGKHVSQVTIDEAAMLCGLIKAPNIYSPLRDRDRALTARNHVLDRMRIEGFLKPEDCELLKKRPIVTNTLSSISRSSHAFHYIREEITKVLGEKRAAAGGFRVFTTLDTHLQHKAERALREHLEEVETREGYQHQTRDQYVKLLKEARTNGTAVPAPKYLQGALLAVDNDDGGIVTMIGGRDFQHFQYNCATQARRPAGSAFIPFVYAQAFENGNYPGSIVTDKVLDNKYVQIGGADGLLGEWALETLERQQYMGEITARQALVLSKNAATVRLGLRVGLEAFLEFVKTAGIESPLREYASSFLGSSEVTLAEMCKAYTLFANGGLRPQELHIIREIQSADGEPIYSSNAAERDLVDALGEFASYQTHSCLEEVLTKGTAKASKELGLQSFPSIGGKTGTAYDFTDTWFIGYNSRITCGVWSGFINPQPIYTGAFSNEICLPIWVDFMNASTRSFTPELITPPEDGKMVEICTVSGQLATDRCYEKIETEGLRYERTAVLEFIPPDLHLSGACEVHSPDSVLETLRLETENIMQTGSLALYGSGTGPTPVLLREPTILGTDPYQSIQPIISRMIPKKEEKKEEEGDEKKVVTKATAVKEAPIENLKARMQVDLPGPIEFID